MRKKKWAAVLLAVSVMMAGCSGGAETAAEATSAAATEAISETESKTESKTEESDYLGKGTVGSKWYASSIEGAITKGTETSLKDDYFTAANQEYLTGLTIDDGYTSAGVFQDASKIMVQRTLELLQKENPESHDGELVSSFYELATDWEGRNEVGLEPILASVERIHSLSSIDEIAEYERSLDDAFFPGLANYGVEISMFDSNYYDVGIDSTSLFLGDPGEYSEQSENGALDEAYCSKVVHYMLGKLGFSQEEADEIWAGCKTFETEIAKHMLTLEDSYADDIFDRIMNKYTLEELREIQGNYPLVEILEAFGLGGSDVYNLSEPEWLSALSELYTEENVGIIKDYFLAHYVADVATELDQETRDAVAEYQHERYGITGNKTEEERGLNVVNLYLSKPLDYVYIDAYCSAQERQEVIDMVQEFKAYYHQMLEQEDWLSEETKQRAIDKLENITIRACYSDVREDYSGLEFASKAEGGSYMEALQAVLNYQLSLKQAKINQKVDRDLWEMSTREVNAYYYPLDNSINILCGILVGAFSMDQSYEAVLATVGGTIGHEISHAFDTSGAQFDQDGNYTNWWKDEDYAAFNERADRLVEYMNQIIPYEGAQAVNGEMQKGEMIADLGGIKACLMIAQDADEFNYDEFFRAVARSWAGITTKNMVLLQMQSDSHPLDNLRVNIQLQHCDEFLETYDIQPGDGMYLAPEDRVNVW